MRNADLGLGNVDYRRSSYESSDSQSAIPNRQSTIAKNNASRSLPAGARESELNSRLKEGITHQYSLGYTAERRMLQDWSSSLRYVSL